MRLPWLDTCDLIFVIWSVIPTSCSTSFPEEERT